MGVKEHCKAVCSGCGNDGSCIGHEHKGKDVQGEANPHNIMKARRDEE